MTMLQVRVDHVVTTARPIHEQSPRTLRSHCQKPTVTVMGSLVMAIALLGDASKLNHVTTKCVAQALVNTAMLAELFSVHCVSR